jgi:hypothetical protein
MDIEEIETQNIIEDTIPEAAAVRKTGRCMLDQPREFSLMADIQQATSPTYIRQAALRIVVSAVTQRCAFSLLFMNDMTGDGICVGFYPLYIPVHTKTRNDSFFHALSPSPLQTIKCIIPTRRRLS